MSLIRHWHDQEICAVGASNCLFKHLCFICPYIDTDVTRRAALQDGKRLAATQVESDFRLYEVRLKGVC
jgi:hypothetical protein